MKSNRLVFIVLCVLLSETKITEAQNKNNGLENITAEEESLFRNYNEIITARAETQKGLFTFHKVGDKYYFELPESILEKEILIATKVSGHVQAKGFSYGAGSQPRSQQIIRFQKKNNLILIRLVTYDAVASRELPINQSVRNNNFETVVYSFRIEAIGKDKSSYIIDVKDFFTGDIPIIGAINEYEKQNFGIFGVDKSSSLINWVKAFPKNVEVRHILTYRASKPPDNNPSGLMSFELNQSLILLPENPMIPRLFDDRVGFFFTEKIDYGLDAQKAETRRYILRRRLLPSDWEAFNRGELVEPIDPIVFYIDPSTPIKWRKYIKQGIEDWQTPFEKIGFKNAILAKDPPLPEEDPNWTPEDIRYSVIRYEARTGQGAVGPNIHDPRTGEILESDILFNHNMMKLLRNWFFVRTAAVNPHARETKLKDEIMGKLIQSVIAHEVGHTLGLAHNPISEEAYSVDSLRSRSFTSKYSTGESIMSYTFNYVAQPGDGVTNFFPQLGRYDDWAIMYGYKPISNIKTPTDEEKIIKQWIDEKQSDKVYRYAITSSMLGDNQVKSAELGIKNLKRIMENIVDWSIEYDSDYKLLNERYDEIIVEFSSYISSIRHRASGLYQYTSNDWKSSYYQAISFEEQKKALNFLNDHLFNTPYWLLNKEAFELMRWENPNPVKELQTRTLSDLLSEYYLEKRVNKSSLIDSDLNPILYMFSFLRENIFSGLKSGEPITLYRRGLQKIMIESLIKLRNAQSVTLRSSDIPSIARENLIIIKEAAKKELSLQKDNLSRYHLQDLRSRIDEALNSH